AGSCARPCGRWRTRFVRPVEDALRRQREFVAAASHELRSPLSVVKLDLEAARARAAEEGAPSARILVEEAERECDGIGALVDDLLSLASGDARGWSVDAQPCDAETLFVEAFDGMDEKAAAADVALVPDLPAEPLPPVLADERRVVQLLRILLENAVAYSPAGGEVRLSLRCEGRFAVFAVADCGPGVPDADKERIFERFYRADPARSGTVHHGLGLSVAREIAEAHGGWVRVRDNEGCGAVFETGVPLSDSAMAEPERCRVGPLEGGIASAAAKIPSSTSGLRRFTMKADGYDDVKEPPWNSKR
ncbi:sensor histidine kinase, partial [Eggerthella sinensis]|uniref:sensor histidine kinase n=1 Tax=Eggerthella sinensis TaxID=242230 RepID=UPI0022E47BD8